MLLPVVLFFISTVFAVPSFDDYANNAQKSGLYDVSQFGVSKDATFIENMQQIFFPYGNSDGWAIWQVLRIVAVWLFILQVVRAWFGLLRHANEEKGVSTYRLYLVQLLYWGFLFFWATYILWDLLNLGTSQWSEWIIDNFQNSLMFQIVAFLKWAAFFLAVIMVIYYGFQMMRANGTQERITEGKKWLINVIVALIFIKVIDFVYYIAQQKDFSSQASEFIVSVSRVMWYALGGLIFLSILYAWVRMVTSAWDEEAWSSAKKLLTTVFLVSVVIMLFLLITYQVITELA